VPVREGGGAARPKEEVVPIVSALSLLRALAVACVCLAVPSTAGADGPAPTDPDAPVIEIASPQDGAGYPAGADVLVGYGCTSQISFVVSCEGTQPLGSWLDTSSAGTKNFTVTAIDYEGRRSTATATYTVFDLTAPTIDLRAPADGAEYEVGADVSIAYTCTDDPGGLGVVFCGGTLPSGVPLDTSRIGTFEFFVAGVDAALNQRTVTVKYRVVDRTPPTITITTPAQGADYLLGSVVPADYACADASPGSGIAVCRGDVPNGGALDTSSVGPKTFTVPALDGARNDAIASRSYRVVYDFRGFFAPIEAPPAVTRFKAGETVPVKFSLNGDQGMNIFAAGSPAWRPASCSSPDTAPDAASARGTLSFNGSADRYLYAWATERSWAGTCRELSVKLRDGTVRTARFAFH
jgi:hypothetical protein